MRLLHLVPLAALSAAIVLPDEQVLAELTKEDHHRDARPDVHHGMWDLVNDIEDAAENAKEQVEEKASDAFAASKNYLDDAISYATDAGREASKKIHETAFDVEGWLEEPLRGGFMDLEKHPEHPPHDGPHHGTPHHKDPHHGHKPHETIYQMISKSKYTTKLAKLISEDDDLVQILNGTKANYTVFAPTDKAFEKIPEHAPKPSKEFIKKLLLYHISPDFYPAGRVLKAHTIPTAFEEPALGEHAPQRLTPKLTLKGLTINFYSRIVAVNIFATNGVIHGLDSILIPPPSVLKILQLLPSEFSTLELGLTKTGLDEVLNETSHSGSTFFAPSNFAFQKLGPRINGFLFSNYGQKYLKALIQYHVSFNNTLYSDAFYKTDSETGEVESQRIPPSPPCPHKSKKEEKATIGGGKWRSPADIKPPKKMKGGPKARAGGRFHVDLPTELEDRSLSVDVARYGPFISIVINGFSRVSVADGVAKDGVINVVSDVLIPPKQLPGGGGLMSMWKGEEMSVEEFKERMDGTGMVVHDEEGLFQQQKERMDL